ncbi:MAG TPA: response regulator transcription factor [Dermatophilaceae bacterium]
MISVLLVDDQPLLRMALSMVLEAHDDLTVCGEAANGAAAVELTAQLKPDVVLLDIRMPVMDGIEATRQIVATGTTSRVLLLTTFDLDEYAYAGLRAGASGFLLKLVEPSELVTAIRAVASGDAVVAPSVTRRLLDTFGPHLPDPAAAHDQAKVTNKLLAPLTEREREVLVEVAHGRSNSEIAARMYLSDATIKTHVGHILAKLGLRDRVQVVVLAYDVGLVQPKPRQ